MVPIYGIVSFLSYVFYQDALYFELIRGQSTCLTSSSFEAGGLSSSLSPLSLFPFPLLLDCYEAFVIASFFYLLLSYLGETERDIKEVFRDKQLDKWMW